MKLLRGQRGLAGLLGIVVQLIPFIITNATSSCPHVVGGVKAAVLAVSPLTKAICCRVTMNLIPHSSCIHYVTTV